MAKSDELLGIDTDYLRPEQLSDEEWLILLRIEERLSEVARDAPRDRDARRDCSDSESRRFAPAHLAKVERRYQRVLLLDGGRGTGKTSLLLTLIKRWHGAAGVLQETRWLNEEQESLLAAYRERKFPMSEIVNVPKNVRVVRNLDFDPLPAGMPLIAGIVQAWRPLADHYDQKRFPSDDLCDDLDRCRLMDLWHSLFRVAVGWSGVTGAKGLIEQVLDQEEQVRDWQDLRWKWLSFVNELIRVGRCMKADHQEDPPVFVIVIDDVDLQVKRISELLPALRLLTHENVFFLIAADREHMKEMLQFDFLGQQRTLAAGGAGGVQGTKITRYWPSVLAEASFEKVFPTRNRWSLGRLSLLDFLKFPRQSNVIPGPSDSRAASKRQTFRRLLTAIVPNPADKKGRGASPVISNLARAAKSLSLDLPALSYRSAQQLWQSAVPAADAEEQATRILAGLLSSADMEAVVRRDAARTIEFQAVGDLTAFYGSGFIDAGEYDIVVSAQPDFWFLSTAGEIVSMRESRGGGFNFTAGLIAKTLQEAQFPVDATALKWETYLSLAWTTWRDIPATFAWTWHKHPRPDELLKQTKKWADYVTKIHERTKLRERHAYAWIYFERQRSLNPSDAESPLMVHPSGELNWAALLKFPETSDLQSEEQRRDVETWKKFTLPLLARPEIGFDLGVQKLLLAQLGDDVDAKRKLLAERRRRMTDAIFVAELQRRKIKNDLPSDEFVRQKLQHIDNRYAQLNHEPSPWISMVGQDEDPLHANETLNGS